MYPCKIDELLSIFEMYLVVAKILRNFSLRKDRLDCSLSLSIISDLRFCSLYFLYIYLGNNHVLSIEYLPYLLDGTPSQVIDFHGLSRS